MSEVCDREASRMRRPRPPRGCRAIGGEKNKKELSLLHDSYLYSTEVSPFFNTILSVLMGLSHHGTFYNNEKVEMAVRELLEIEESDFSSNGVFFNSCQECKGTTICRL